MARKNKIGALGKNDTKQPYLNGSASEKKRKESRTTLQTSLRGSLGSKSVTDDSSFWSSSHEEIILSIQKLLEGEGWRNKSELNT